MIRDGDKDDPALIGRCAACGATLATDKADEYEEIISILDVLRIEVDALMCLANNLGNPKMRMISWEGPASTELEPRLAALRTKHGTRTSHPDPQPTSIQQQKEEIK